MQQIRSNKNLIVTIPSNNTLWRLYTILAHKDDHTTMYVMVFHYDNTNKLFFSETVQVFKRNLENKCLEFVDEAVAFKETDYNFADPNHIYSLDCTINNPSFVMGAHVSYQSMIEFSPVKALQTEEMIADTICQFIGNVGKRIKIKLSDIESKVVDVKTAQEAEIFLESIKHLLYNKNRNRNIN